MMGIAMIAFACAYFIKPIPGFLAVAFVTRFMQGFASASIQTSCYAITSIVYPHKQAAIIGYIECCIGVGLVLGPVLGVILYQAGGFICPFIVSGIVFMFASFFTYSYIPP